jgi:hypothetical protein
LKDDDGCEIQTPLRRGLETASGTISRAREWMAREYNK